MKWLQLFSLLLWFLPTAAQKYIPADSKEWLDLQALDATIVIDIRYATDNNFMKEQVYDCGRCYLRAEVARAIVRAHQHLQKQGLGLKMYDCYRPRPIQWKLWNKVPNPNYVADPRKGSMHNRGSAVDLTIVDARGKELDMGTDYDYFGKEGHHDYTDLPKPVIKNRELLRQTMLDFGFQWIRTEWWHYSYKSKSYPLADVLWRCE
ncbi:MAG TPA: D-alanyl-D-alanine dipeptidase [Saprospiraceae bacterium]|nr:D-alanyl-D-alanine dipeptidase [Saprospiraceae bacterium]HMP22524.1 D-alanyl-D-alanine dipeptidase [Saprospiraceae bacterium]